MRTKNDLVNSFAMRLKLGSVGLGVLAGCIHALIIEQSLGMRNADFSRFQHNASLGARIRAVAQWYSTFLAVIGKKNSPHY